MEDQRINNITKQDALNYMKGKDKSYVINAVIRATLYGEEYKDNYRYGALEMSYFCRAFNITEFNAGKGRNRIKNRYKKFSEREGLEEYYRSVLTKKWPGFDNEEPSMDDILANYATSEPEDYEGFRQQGKGASGRLRTISGNTESRDSKAQGGIVAVILGLVILVAGIVVLLKTIGKALTKLTGVAGIIGDMLGSMTFWEILSFLAFYGGIIYAIVLLVRKKNKNKLLWAASVFMTSFLFGALGEGDMGGILLYSGVICVLMAIGNRKKQ